MTVLNTSAVLNRRSLLLGAAPRRNHRPARRLLRR